MHFLVACCISGTFTFSTTRVSPSTPSLPPHAGKRKHHACHCRGRAAQARAVSVHRSLVSCVAPSEWFAQDKRKGSVLPRRPSADSSETPPSPLPLPPPISLPSSQPTRLADHDVGREEVELHPRLLLTAVDRDERGGQPQLAPGLSWVRGRRLQLRDKPDFLG